MSEEIFPEVGEERFETEDGQGEWGEASDVLIEDVFLLKVITSLDI